MMTKLNSVALVWVVFAVAGSSGCSGSDDSLIVLNFKTDQLDLSVLEVAVLGADDQVIDSHWLSVSNTCQADAAGWLDLGSALIENGTRLDTARVRVSAYRDQAGFAVTAGDQRVDVVVRRGTTAVDVQLARSCRDTVACAGSNTCDPVTGGCHEVPRIDSGTKLSSGRGPYCLTPLGMAPAIGSPSASDAGTSPTVGPMDGGSLKESACVVGDHVCPNGCHGDRDADCLVPVGKACSTTTESCVAGAFCRHGFCCDQPCNGSCERCDQPPRPGHCARLVYSALESPLTDPGFSVECASDNIAISCTNGACTHQCLNGFDSCDMDLESNGCEKRLGTATDCGKCRDACVYSYCDGKQCTWNHTTDLAIDGSSPLAAGAVYATRLVRTSPDTKIRALGALVDQSFAGKKIRLALYSIDQDIIPYELVAQTDELLISDNESSGVAAPSAGIRVEQTLSADVPINQPFFIAVQVSERVQLFGSPSKQVEWNVAAFEFGEFPEFFPFPADAKNDMAWSVYAITTTE